MTNVRFWGCGTCGPFAYPAGSTPNFCPYCRAPISPPAAYWQNETSGILRPAIEAYLRHDQLAEADVAALRAYLRQWIMSPAWDRNPHATEADGEILAELRHGVDRLHTREAIDLWLYEADALGIDPL
jgi:hypothetical protein